jgi:hypothetical protein
LAAGGAFGRTPLWHFLVRFPAKRQFVQAALLPHLGGTPQLKALTALYVRMYSTAYVQALQRDRERDRGSVEGTSAGLGTASGGAAAGGVAGGPVGAALPSGAAGAAAVAAAAAAAAASAYVLPASQPRPARLVWVSGPHCVAACLPDREVELYVTFDPLTDKELGLRICEQLKRHFADRTRQTELLMSA